MSRDSELRQYWYSSYPTVSVQHIRVTPVGSTTKLQLATTLCPTIGFAIYFAPQSKKPDQLKTLVTLTTLKK